MSTRVVRTPGVLSGRSRLEGTRWPTHIAHMYGYDRARIHRAYPHLTIAQIDAAIRYERHPRRRLARWLTMIGYRPRIRLARMLAGDQWGNEP